MRAIVLDQFGAPDVLTLRDDVPEPEPGPGEVRVRVHATSVNPVDAKIRQHGGFGVEAPAIVGYDVSGVVDGVGEGVEDLVEGDEVFYTAEINANGTYAEIHVADAGIVVVKPHDLTHVEAAAIPLAACTAWQALIDRAGLELGEFVLIHGGGGVGHYAVQIAHAAGARVVVVGSPDMEDALLGFGADLFVSYHDADGTDAMMDLSCGLGADVIFDTVGGDTLVKSLPALATYGRMVTIVGDAAGAFGAVAGKNGTVHGLMMERDGGRLDRISMLAEAGDLEPLVADVLPLAEAAEAHRRIEAGGVHGKLVLTP